MHASVVASVLLAAVAIAKPVAKPAVVTEVTYVTEVVHVYVDAAEQTPPPQAQQKNQRGSVRWEWGHNHHNNGKKDEDKKEEPTTTTEVVSETPAPQTSSVEEQYVPAPAEETPVQEQPQPQPQTEEEEEAPEQEYEPETAPAQTAPSGSYRQKCLEHHNMHRLNHSAPALEWDDELESIAQTTANTCYYGHDM